MTEKLDFVRLNFSNFLNRIEVNRIERSHYRYGTVRVRKRERVWWIGLMSLGLLVIAMHIYLFHNSIYSIQLLSYFLLRLEYSSRIFYYSSNSILIRIRFAKFAKSLKIKIFFCIELWFFLDKPVACLCDLI